MKKIILALLCGALSLGLCATTQAAKISPEGRTIEGWNSWDVISGTAVTTRIDPKENGRGRDEMIKLDGGKALTTFDKSFDGVTKVMVDVWGEANINLCSSDGNELVTIGLSDGLINGTECEYVEEDWNKLVIYTLPAISSYDVYLYNGDVHTKVLRGTMTVAPVVQFSVSTSTTAYIDNIKVEYLEKLEKLSDELLTTSFSSSSADDFKKVNGSGAESTSYTDYRYGNVEFEGETVFRAEDRRNESGTSTRTARYAYKKLDTPITGSAVYSFDIYSEPLHLPTGATEKVDNDARLVFHSGGIKTDQLLYLQQTKLTASSNYSARYPEGRWFNLRVELIKETGYVNYYVTYVDDNGETVINTIQRPADFDAKAVSICFNNRQDRNGLFYLKNISVSSVDDTEAMLNSFSVTTEWEDSILRGSVDEYALNAVTFTDEDGSGEYTLPQENGMVKSVDISDYVGAFDGKLVIVAVFDNKRLSGCDVIKTNGTGEYPLSVPLRTKEDSVVKVFCWEEDTISPVTPPLEINTDRHILDGKKVIIVGNSYTYYGKTVIDQAQYVGSKIKVARFNDKGYFYQLCKQNGADVKVTNWTWGGHGLNDMFTDSCAADRGHDGHNHIADLMANTDMDYDYVIIQPGTGGTVESLSAAIENLQSVFKKENPRVKFILSVHTSYYRFNSESNKEILDSLDSMAQKYGLIVANWGKLVTDVINGDAVVENATMEYNKNTFTVSKSSNDGYHPNMLTGYITSQMFYSAITGESAVGEKYAFCTDKKVNSNFLVSTFLKKYYTYDNISNDKSLTGDDLTNFPEIFKSPADMEGIQRLIDSYL